MKKIKETYYKIALDNKKHQPFQTVRIVLLSDLHNQMYGEENEQLLQQVQSMKPDLIIAAGDLVTADEKNSEGVALSLMKRLAFSYPIYYANGNHEYLMKLDTQEYGMRYSIYAKELRKAGVNLLENEYMDVNIKGMSLRIYGLELPWRFYRRLRYEKPQVEDIKACLQKASEDKYKVLIAHNPVYFNSYAQWGADLTVSGHLHGGFMRLPLIGGIISPQFRLFPKYDKGLFEENGKHLVVSAGVGTHSILPRIGNPVEIVGIDLG